MSSSRAPSSATTLWTRPLATATSGPPSSSLVTSSPSEASTTGGPAVNTQASAVIREKSDIGTIRAPWPAEAPITPVTTGTRPESRACWMRSVGARAGRGSPGRGGR